MNTHKHEREFVLHEKINSMDETSSLNFQKNFSIRKAKKKRGDDRTDIGSHDNVNEREYEGGMTHRICRKDTLHPFRENRTFQNVNQRNMPCMDRMHSMKNNRNLSKFDLDHSKKHLEDNYRFGRYGDKMSMLFHDDDEFNIKGSRNNAFLLKNQLHNSRQPRENHLDLPSCNNFRDVFFQRNTDHFSEHREQCHTPFDRKYTCFENDAGFVYEKHRHTGQLRHTHTESLDDNEVGLNHQVRADSYSPETSYFARRSSNYASKYRTCKSDKNGFAKCCLLDNHGRKIVEESRIFGRKQKDALTCGIQISIHSNALEEKLKRKHTEGASKMRKQDISKKKFKIQGDFSSTETSRLQDISIRTLKKETDCSLFNVNSNQLQPMPRSPRFNLQGCENHAVLGDTYSSEPEEGELIEEPDLMNARTITKGFVCVEKVPQSPMEPNLPKFKDKNLDGDKETHLRAFISDSKFGSKDNYILTMLEKMEKRRERFKDPAAKKVPKKHQSCQYDSVQKTEETAKARPARKRSWNGGIS